MVKKLVKAAKFDSKKAAKDIAKSISDMQEEIMHIAMTIDEAEEATPYKLERIGIDNAISLIDRNLENLDKYCERIFKNYKTEI